MMIRLPAQGEKNLRENGRSGASMRCCGFCAKGGAMPMEEDRRGGHSALTVVVRRQTVEELHKKGLKANPESAVYKNTFNRLAAKYRHDQAAMMKDRKKQNDAWLETHANDTDEQLIAYLRGAVTDPAQCRKPGSVPGGYCLARRFGGWKKALAAAGLTEAEEPQPEKQAQPPPEQPQPPPEEQSQPPPEAQ